jgi:hypothetical protein
VSALALLVKASITAQTAAESIASLFVGIMFIFMFAKLLSKRCANEKEPIQ